MTDRGVLSTAELRNGAGRVYYGIAMFILLVMAVISLFPFFFAFTSGLKNNVEIFAGGLNLLPETPLWGNYSDVWERFKLPRLLANSFLIVGGSVAFRVIISSMAAYSLSQLKPKGGKYVMMGFLLTLMVPAIAYIVPQYLIIGDIPIIHVSLLGSYWGLWLPYGVDAFAIFVFKTFFDRVPKDIIDSARIDGASAMQILRHIMLPLSRSIFIVIAVVSFVNLWRDFLLPLLVLPDPEMQPITVRLIYLTQQYGVNLQMAASFIGLLPPLLIAVFLQRYMQVGVTGGAVRG